MIPTFGGIDGKPNSRVGVGARWQVSEEHEAL